MAKMSGKMNLEMTSMRFALDGNLDINPRDLKRKITDLAELLNNFGLLLWWSRGKHSGLVA